MNTIRQELQDYLSSHYPHSKIDTEHTLAGQITIRFNSSENDLAEAHDRINEAVERGSLIFHQLFEGTNHSLWVIAYEYAEDQIFRFESDYFFEQFSQDTKNELLSSEETVNSQIMSIDDYGDEMSEVVKAKINIGKTSFQSVNIQNILRGIANRENGYEPVILKSVYFLDPLNHTGFHMFDDRGFFAWANDADKLRSIYHDHINWISEHTREDIDPYFQ